MESSQSEHTEDLMEQAKTRFDERKNRNFWYFVEKADVYRYLVRHHRRKLFGFIPLPGYETEVTPLDLDFVIWHFSNIALIKEHFKDITEEQDLVLYADPYSHELVLDVSRYELASINEVSGIASKANVSLPRAIGGESNLWVFNKLGDAFTSYDQYKEFTDEVRKQRNEEVILIEA